LNEAPLSWCWNARRSAICRWLFPAKFSPTRRSGRLFIADSDPQSDRSGKLDGTLWKQLELARMAPLTERTIANFLSSAGIALNGETLYVADTENHLNSSGRSEIEDSDDHRSTGQQSRRLDQIGMAGAPL